MRATIVYKKFFAYSEDNNKSFCTTFNDGINIIFGRNTSGKSTLIQAILYTFGINDEKTKLDEVLKENVIFRLDFILKNEKSEEITIIRNNEFISIKRENQPVKKFIGISGNNSNEHKKLKEFLGELFNFKLYLESDGEYKPAAIEAMFLPYYIAQDVGWVYRHKSFRGLDFVKNFKRDFFDYYLGIVNDYNREEKQRLENLKKEYQNEIDFLERTEKKNDDLLLSKFKDERFISKSAEYLERYKENKSNLISLEKEYLVESNKLSYLEQRRTILKRTKSALNKQIPYENKCPACDQILQTTLETAYEHFQNFNDTEKQLEDINKNISELKKEKGKINSLEIKIKKYRNLISKEYSILAKYSIEDLTVNSWIENKANIQLAKNIINQIGEITIKLDDTIEKLKAFKTDKDIEKERSKYDYNFKNIFKNYLSKLNVKAFNDERFMLLYKIPAFPRQGVELLKTLLAYSFAFNKIIKETSYVHRFPLLLDAIFEGDLDDSSKEDILLFIYNNYPKDTQVIMSIADSEDNKTSASDYNRIFLKNEANLICIGENSHTRAFLSEYDNKSNDYLVETLGFMD